MSEGMGTFLCKSASEMVRTTLQSVGPSSKGTAGNKRCKAFPF